jgi:hypothetical protein
VLLLIGENLKDLLGHCVLAQCFALMTDAFPVVADSLIPVFKRELQHLLPVV